MLAVEDFLHWCFAHVFHNPKAYVLENSTSEKCTVCYLDSVLALYRWVRSATVGVYFRLHGA